MHNKMRTGYKKLLKLNVVVFANRRLLPGEAHIAENECVNVCLGFQRFPGIARAVAGVGIDPDQ